MYFSIHNRRLLSGMVAGAVALASASACSRSDRADSQASPSASASAQANTATQPTTGTQPSSADTATATPSTRRPRSSGARASVANGDQGVSGYKAMAQDSSTASANVDNSAQVSAAAPQPSDTSAVASVTDTAVKADTTATEMARDTTDTATIGDTAVILTHADTTQQTEVAVGDSTADAAAVGAAGIASTGNIATGADAVALMSRQGKRCVVAASDENRDVLWDMASSPSSLNPCGTGTMTLPRIWTGEKR